MLSVVLLLLEEVEVQILEMTLLVPTADLAAGATQGAVELEPEMKAVIHHLKEMRDRQAAAAEELAELDREQRAAQERLQILADLV